MRKALTAYKTLALMAAAFFIGACSNSPPPPSTTQPVLSADAQRVRDALDRWPNIPTSQPELKRTFFATIHVAGHRTTASGLLQFHNPRDFRITAITETGVILFDGRMNWAGVTVLRALPGIDKGVIGSLLSDLALAFQIPNSLDKITPRGNSLILRTTGADTNKYQYTFDSKDGMLRKLDVDMGLFDTLHIDYLRYLPNGWPKQMTATRKARFYTISFTFTDDEAAAAFGTTHG